MLLHPEPVTSYPLAEELRVTPPAIGQLTEVDVAIDFLAHGLPTFALISQSPVYIRVTLGGEGITITRLVTIGAVGSIARRLYHLNTTGYPQAELRPEENESG